jgi:hypothetical protein
VLFLFRRDNIGVQLFLLIYVIALRAVGLFGALPHSVEHGKIGYLYGSLETFGVNHGGIAFWVSAICLWIQAMMINHLFIKYKLTDQKTWFAGLMYVFTCSFLPIMHYLSAPLIANFFLIPAIGQLYSTYRLQECRKSIFNVGLFGGIAALISPGLSLLFLVFYIGFNSLRAFRLKEQCVFAIGFLAPYLLLGSIAFLRDDFDGFWNAQFKSVFGLPHLDMQMQLSTKVGMVFWLVILGLIIFSTLQFFTRKVLQVQKYYSFLYWLLIFSVFLLLFQHPVRISTLYGAAIPIAFLAALSIEQLKNRPLAETIHLIFLAVLFFIHFFIGVIS